MARKIILKEVDLSQSSNPPSGYRYLAFDSEYSALSERNGGTVSVIQFTLEYVKGKLIEATIVSSSQQPELAAAFENITSQILTSNNYTAIVAGVGLLSSIVSSPETIANLLQQYNDLTGLNITL